MWKKCLCILGLAALFAAELPAAPKPARKPTAPKPGPALILYDASGEFGFIGGLHARMLANLLGHFPLDYSIKPVENYLPGDIARSRVTFYLGSVFNNPLPPAFLAEAMSGTTPVCWFKYNLWQLGALLGPGFEARYGFRFEFMDQTGFPDVFYKGEALAKNQLDRELGRTTIINPNVAQMASMACTADGAACIPYALRGGNLWYIADAPFAFIAEDDRYLIFADLLHDIVGIDHAENHRALIRLEDLHPRFPTDVLRDAADLLAAEGVPFLAAVIPAYVDPLGAYNDGVPEVATLAKSREFADTLRYLIARGGQLVIHGYTHQYSNLPNPYNGVSGDDYEFFRVTLNPDGSFNDYQAVPEDSRKWVQGRVEAAQQEFKKAKLPFVAWEPPHYAASAASYDVFAKVFPLTIQRALYFDTVGNTAGKPKGMKKKKGEEMFAGSGRLAGQFFPYVIHRDLYGQKVAPENLGNIDPFMAEGYPTRLPEHMIRFARKARVIRDGWASGFFHPYLDLGYLPELVRGIKAEGYQFVPLSKDVQ